MMNVLFDKPFALSIGPQKCGAVRLERYFRGRGDVCLPTDVQEICFFDRHFQRGADFYVSHFDPAPEHVLVMELSTTAFDTLEAPAMVEEILGPTPRLFCPLRHPVERSYEVYQDYLRYGIVNGSIEDAAQQAPQILYSSRYHDHMERWFERFGAAQITILFYEEFAQDEQNYIRRLCESLSLPYIESEDVFNSTKETRREKWPRFIENVFDVMKPKEEQNSVRADRDKAWLAARLSDDIAYYERLVSGWRPG